eukprot:Nk52_evm41s230 gene=Nk52_evmTU41s230
MSTVMTSAIAQDITSAAASCTASDVCKIENTASVALTENKTIESGKIGNDHQGRNLSRHSSSGRGDGEKLTGDELVQALKKQLEYYFSRENMSQDVYLVSQMNSDLYVPIATIAKFKMVRYLTEDMNLIIETLRSSSVVKVDETGTKVKPLVNLKRNTLILRDISSEKDATEVGTIFEGEGCPKPTNIRSDIGDTWFVTFEDENATTDALLYIRGKEFDGKAIKARVKSESLLRGTLPPKTNSYNAAAPQHNVHMQQSAAMYNGAMYSQAPNGVYYPGQQMHWPPVVGPYDYGYEGMMNGDMQGVVGNEHMVPNGQVHMNAERRTTHPFGGPKAKRTGRDVNQYQKNKNGNNVNSNGNTQKEDAHDAPVSASQKKRNRKKKNENNAANGEEQNQGSKKENKPSKVEKPIELAPFDFPPLNGEAEQGEKDGVKEQAPQMPLVSGYAKVASEVLKKSPVLTSPVATRAQKKVTKEGQNASSKSKETPSVAGEQTTKKAASDEASTAPEASVETEKKGNADAEGDVETPESTTPTKISYAALLRQRGQASEEAVQTVTIVEEKPVKREKKGNKSRGKNSKKNAVDQ